MKKVLYAALCFTALAHSAHAEEAIKFKPYLGLDLQRSIYSYNNNYDFYGTPIDVDDYLEDALNGFNVHVGSKVHENFGVELGYFRTQEGSKDVAGIFTTDVKVQGLTLDALGYLPLGEQEKFELIGTAGISWSKAKLALTMPGIGSVDDDESEIGFRLGAGAQFNLTDKINMRGLARYQSADFEDVADRAWTYSLGMNYSF